MSETPESDLELMSPPERDENTDDMFGAPPSAAPSAPKASQKDEAYTVLARKYRPRTFEDLIGQEAMVRTLTHAFASGRIAHAFMLTGVRGVGKTTTARLLARALNYESDTVTAPSVHLKTQGVHCQAIIEGRHIDVLELDAASRTGVDAMRDLLDSVRYAPVEARFKVYIIDEVHMLSTGAFNALLKTLEEPPAHVKFIFATTEIRKVPVTILSRCQRFDLRRVEPETLMPHLTRLCEIEGVKIEADALALIARAAEGSVRDGLSLLDQALVQGDADETVNAEQVRDMLGLADRSVTLGLFENLLSGQLTEALLAYRTLYGFGADPAQIMNDLLEYAHAASVAKALGPEATRMGQAQAMRLTALGTQVSAGLLSRLWGLMLKGLEDIRKAPDASAAMEMALVKLCYVSDLPPPESVLKSLQSGDIGGSGNGPRGGGGGVASGPSALAVAPAMAVNTNPQTFDEVLRLIEAKRDISLRVDVERYVRLVSFQVGAITFEPAPNAPNDLARKLSFRLKEWTGQRWLIATEQSGGAETVFEREDREKTRLRAEIEQNPFVKSVLNVIEGATIVNIRPRLPQGHAPVVNDDDETEKDDD